MKHLFFALLIAFAGATSPCAAQGTSSVDDSLAVEILPAVLFGATLGVSYRRTNPYTGNWQWYFARFSDSDRDGKMDVLVAEVIEEGITRTSDNERYYFLGTASMNALLRQRSPEVFLHQNSSEPVGDGDVGEVITVRIPGQASAFFYHPFRAPYYEPPAIELWRGRFNLGTQLFTILRDSGRDVGQFLGDLRKEIITRLFLPVP